MYQCTDSQLNTLVDHSWVLYFGLLMTSCSLSACTCFFRMRSMWILPPHLPSHLGSLQMPTALDSFFDVLQGAGEGVRSMVLRLPLVYLEGPWTTTFGVPLFRNLEHIARDAGFVPYIGSGENLQTPMRLQPCMHAYAATSTGRHLVPVMGSTVLEFCTYQGCWGWGEEGQ